MFTTSNHSGRSHFGFSTTYQPEFRQSRLVGRLRYCWSGVGATIARRANDLARAAFRAAI